MDCFDKKEIGMSAGKLWHLLSDNNKWNFEDLKKASDLSDIELAAAMGWLAREDKIEIICTDDHEIMVYLNVNVFIG